MGVVVRIRQMLATTAKVKLEQRHGTTPGKATLEYPCMPR